MRGYRRAWRTWWLLLCVAGTVASVLLWPGPVVLLTWLFGATLGLAVVTMLRSEPGDPHPLDRLGGRDLATGVLVGAVVGSGLTGWMGISGGGALAMVAVAGLSSPRCLIRVRSLLARDEPARSVTTTDVRLMSTAQLCDAWQQTFRRGTGAPDLRLLALRESFLDELCRREPDGLDAWMTSAVPVDVAPTVFFGQRPPEVSP